jgi:hypothetical protein
MYIVMIFFAMFAKLGLGTMDGLYNNVQRSDTFKTSG